MSGSAVPWAESLPRIPLRSYLLRGLCASARDRFGDVNGSLKRATIALKPLERKRREPRQDRPRSRFRLAGTMMRRPSLAGRCGWRWVRVKAKAGAALPLRSPYPSRLVRFSPSAKPSRPGARPTRSWVAARSLTILATRGTEEGQLPSVKFLTTPPPCSIFTVAGVVDPQRSPYVAWMLSGPAGVMTGRQNRHDRYHAKPASDPPLRTD
jgi:hypothetical protein